MWYSPSHHKFDQLQAHGDALAISYFQILSHKSGTRQYLCLPTLRHPTIYQLFHILATMKVTIGIFNAGGSTWWCFILYHDNVPVCVISILSASPESH